MSKYRVVSTRVEQPAEIIDCITYSLENDFFTFFDFNGDVVYCVMSSLVWYIKREDNNG